MEVAARQGNADQPGRGAAVVVRSLSGRVHAVQQVWVRPLVLAGGSTSGGHPGGYGVQRRCDLRGAAAASAYFQDDGGGRDILLGLRGGGAVGSPSRVGRG
jgi:hypothetical protein